jgi:hypothetical protein
MLCRTGCYAGHSGSILQLLVLGDQLLSLGKDGQLLVWKIGEYDAPQVREGEQSAVETKSAMLLTLMFAAYNKRHLSPQDYHFQSIQNDPSGCGRGHRPLCMLVGHVCCLRDLAMSFDKDSVHPNGCCSCRPAWLDS